MKIGDRVEVISTPEEFYPLVFTGEKGCIAEFIVCSTVIELESGFRFVVINKNFDKYLKILPAEIDLSVNQIVEPMVDAWFRGGAGYGWHKTKLMSIDHRATFPYKSKLGATWKQCLLTDPNKNDNEFMSYEEAVRFMKINNINLYFEEIMYGAVGRYSFENETEKYFWQAFDLNTYTSIGDKKQFLKKYLKGLDCE